jgi:ATP-dependent Clp protease ATP-binding subunit ClpC
MRILQAVEATAAADGVPTLDGEHLLRGLLDDRDSLAVRVLGAIDIGVRQVRAELDRRTADAFGGPPTPSAASGRLSAELVQVFELAINESSGFGHNYLGTEHLLLGLVGEPAGIAGRVLRSLGADLRVTRRTVAAALAGYGAGAAAQRSAGHVASSHAADITAAIRAELAPVLARVERLEGQLAV